MSHPEKQPPPGITVTQKEQYLEIVYARTRQFDDLPILIGLGFISTMFLSGARTNRGLSLVAIVLFICFLGVAYYQLIKAFNKIHIFITPKKLIVRHRPFFQLGNKEIPTNYIQEVRLQEKRQNLLETAVTVVKYGGGTEKLFSTPVLEDAEYIQQKIMVYLAE